MKQVKTEKQKRQSYDRAKEIRERGFKDWRGVKNIGLPQYTFDCTRCFWKGVSLGALEMHIHFSHMPQ